MVLKRLNLVFAVTGIAAISPFFSSPCAATVAIRQTASVQGPGRNCADTDTGIVCTPTDDTVLPLTLNFAATVPGTAVGLLSNGAGQCNDNLGQLWTPHFITNGFNVVFWISPDQTAGITSVTCNGISQTQIHFFEISGVQTLPQFLGVGGNGSQLGQFGCGSIAQGALGLFLVGDEEGWLETPNDPGLPPMSSISANLTLIATTSIIDNFFSPGYAGPGIPAFQHNRDSLLSFYGLGGTTGLASAFSATNPMQNMTFPPGGYGGVGAGCISIQFLPQQSHFQLSPAALNFPGPLPPIDVPSEGGQLNTPLSFKLGQYISLQYNSIDPQTGQSTPIPSTMTFQKQQPTSLGNLSNIFSDPTVLFANNVLLHFTDPNPDEFFAVHSGRSVVYIKPNDPNSGAPEVFLTVNIPSCSLGQSCSISLGSTHNHLSDGTDLDSEIVRFADFRGIPPQIIKSHVAQEAALDQHGEFDPKTYRYEPLSIDFADFYHGRNLRVASRFSEYRFATFPDSVNKNALSQGGLLMPEDEARREDLFVAVNPQTGIPLPDMTLPVLSSVDRKINGLDTLVTMENILFTNDKAHFKQNWSTVVGGPPRFRNYLNYRLAGGSPFVGQTALASSFGLLQMTYLAAVDKLGFVINASGIGQAPHLLFEPPTSLDLGTEFIASEFPSVNPSSIRNFEELKGDFKPAFGKYNARRQYPDEVLNRMPQFLPH